MNGDGILEDLKLEARRVLDAAHARELRVKLLGGIAIRYALGDHFPEALTREYGDIDLFTIKRHASELESMLADLGWEPAAQFNAINGSRRMLFSDPGSDRKIDVFIDDFEMCHKLPLKKRFDLPGDTLDPADLLMTKLQIIELNAKDRGDAYAILTAFPLAEGNEGIDVAWIASLTAKDWGLQHTLELNLDRLRDSLPESPLADEQRAGVARSIELIEAAMDEAPKSRSWKIRDRVGERKKWYDEPEEID